MCPATGTCPPHMAAPWLKRSICLLNTGQVTKHRGAWSPSPPSTTPEGVAHQWEGTGGGLALMLHLPRKCTMCTRRWGSRVCGSRRLPVIPQRTVPGREPHGLMGSSQ